MNFRSKKSVITIMAFTLLLASAYAAFATGSIGTGSMSPGMYTGMKVEEYGSLNGTSQAQSPPLYVIEVPCVEQERNSRDQGPPKNLAQQEWNRNDDFLGPSHNGLEGHFTWR
jgi:hypothetical protein